MKGKKWLVHAFVIFCVMVLAACESEASEPETAAPEEKDTPISKPAPAGSSFNNVNVITVAGSGSYNEQDGSMDEASFRAPAGIVLLDDETMLVSDTENHRIRQLKNNEVSTYAGFQFPEIDGNGDLIVTLMDGSLETAFFNEPKGLAVDDDGNVYVADSGNHAIRKIDGSGNVTTVAGNGVFGDDDGKGKHASFYNPSDVAVADDGTIYVADTLNHVIRKISEDGEVTTLNAPSDRVVEMVDGYVVTAGDFQDGDLGQAKFNEPTSLVMDASGNLYVADSGNHVIRYIDFEGEKVTTVAGVTPVYEENALYATAGFVDGDANDAMFNFPKGLAVTAEEGLVIADSMNHVIRYLYDGSVMTLAGTGEKGDTDGEAKATQFHYPTDVTVNQVGNLFITDSYNNKIKQLTNEVEGKDND